MAVEFIVEPFRPSGPCLRTMMRVDTNYFTHNWETRGGRERLPSRTGPKIDRVTNGKDDDFCSLARTLGEGLTIHSPSVLFFKSGNQLVHTNSTFKRESVHCGSAS